MAKFIKKMNGNLITYRKICPLVIPERAGD